LAVPARLLHAGLICPSAANCGQNPTCSLRIGDRQPAFSNAGAKKKSSVTDSINPLISKGILPAQLFFAQTQDTVHLRSFAHQQKF
jgi:hypothetical protein